MSCCTSTTRPTASTADPPQRPSGARPSRSGMAPGLRKLRLRPAPARRKPHLTRNVHGSHPSMHVFSLGRFCASPKPSPRGEDAELCSPDAVEASRPLRRRRSRAASCVISCFQSSMLLHNLSSVFSLGKKASQRALRSSRVLLRTIATAHPAAASPHHTTPRPTVLHHATPRPAVPHHTAPRPTVPHHAAPQPTVPHHVAPRPAVPHHAAPRRSPASLPSAGPIPRCSRFSTEFSTFLPVSHSGFLSPWLSWRETASDLLSRGFFLQRKTRYGTVLYGTVRYGAA